MALSLVSAKLGRNPSTRPGVLSILPRLEHGLIADQHSYRIQERSAAGSRQVSTKLGLNPSTQPPPSYPSCPSIRAHYWPALVLLALSRAAVRVSAKPGRNPSIRPSVNGWWLSFLSFLSFLALNTSSLLTSTRTGFKNALQPSLARS